VVALLLVEHVQRLGIICITATIDDIQSLARVRVKETESVLVRGRGRRFRAAAPEDRRQQKQENKR
jgi:hypothetical protein